MQPTAINVAFILRRFCVAAGAGRLALRVRNGKQKIAMLSEDKKWYRVSLRFTGDHLPFAEIEKKLDLTPSYVGGKGEHIRGNPKFAKHASNVWVWRYPSSPDVPFEEQIAGLIDILESKMASLKEILSIPETIGELFLGFGSGNGQGGADFSSLLLKRISECGLMLSLDLYPPSIDEEDDLWRLAQISQKYVAS